MFPYWSILAGPPLRCSYSRYGSYGSRGSVSQDEGVIMQNNACFLERLPNFALFFLSFSLGFSVFPRKDSLRVHPKRPAE